MSDFCCSVYFEEKYNINSDTIKKKIKRKMIDIINKFQNNINEPHSISHQLNLLKDDNKWFAVYNIYGDIESDFEIDCLVIKCDLMSAIIKEFKNDEDCMIINIC